MTAANASKLNDGATALVRRDTAAGVKPLARIRYVAVDAVCHDKC